MAMGAPAGTVGASAGVGALAVGASIGRIAAEQITPYPPGIPAVVPGERINREVIEYLLSGLEAGMVLPDHADPRLETIRVTAQRDGR